MTRKRIAPVEDWNDAPLAIQMRVSSAWISLVINELIWLTNPNVWYGDEVERDRASQAIDSIIIALGAENVELQIMPIGTIIQSALDAPPAGFLLCNGAAVSRATYAALFNAIGTRFGIGDGNTTFNLPDLRSRFVRGKPDAGNVGDVGGSESVALDIEHMPAHHHSFNIRTVNGGFGAGMPQGTSTGASGSFDTQNTGAGAGHENRPPYLDLNCFIAYQ